jgi:hypothetical protein
MHLLILTSLVQNQITINLIKFKTVRRLQILIHNNKGKFILTAKGRKLKVIFCKKT